MYALRIDGKRDTKKVKSIKSNMVSKSITFDDYTQYFFDKIKMTRKPSCIISKLHEMYTISETKITHSPYDNKWYIVPDSTNTLLWGHYIVTPVSDHSRAKRYYMIPAAECEEEDRQVARGNGCLEFLSC